MGQRLARGERRRPRHAAPRRGAMRVRDRLEVPRCRTLPATRAPAAASHAAPTPARTLRATIAVSARDRAAPARLIDRRVGGLGTPSDLQETAWAGGGSRVAAALCACRGSQRWRLRRSRPKSMEAPAPLRVSVGTDWAMPAWATALMDLLEREKERSSRARWRRCPPPWLAAWAPAAQGGTALSAGCAAFRRRSVVPVRRVLNPLCGCH